VETEGIKMIDKYGPIVVRPGDGSFYGWWISEEASKTFYEAHRFVNTSRVLHRDQAYLSLRALMELLWKLNIIG
jgi:hypothetical protein